MSASPPIDPAPMDFFDPSPNEPTRSGGLMRFIIDHNPFYLLSALCMLAGCLMLSNTLTYSPIPPRRILMLIGTLNTYELMLIGIAVWLLVRRRIPRDGNTLLCIEAVFLADGAFLNSELFTVNFRLGLTVCALLLVLAVFKLMVVFVALRIPLPRTLPAITTMLALLYATPGYFKHIAGDSGHLPPLAIFSLWWLVGALPLLMLLIRRELDYGPVKLFVGVALVSLLVHLRLSNWVYRIDWEWSNLGPLLVGSAAAVGAISELPLRVRQALQLALPLLAVGLSVGGGPYLNFEVMSIPFSPLRTMLVCSSLVYLYAAIVSGNVLFMIAVIAAMSFGLLGAGPGVMWKRLTHIIEVVQEFLTSLVPTTTQQWGVTALGASFVLLLLGAAVSMLKRPAERES